MPLQNRRSFERRTCWLRLLDEQGRPLGEVANLSEGGLLLEADIDARKTPFVAGSFQLPDSTDSLTFSAAVTWQKPAPHESTTGLAGLRFVDVPAISRRRLQEHLATSRVNDLLKALQKAGLITGKNLKPFGDVAEIRRLLTAAQSNGSPLNIFWRDGHRSVSPAILDIAPGTLLLDMGAHETDTIKTFAPIFVEVPVDNRNYYFEAVIKGVGARTAKITVPDMLFVGERRVEARQAARPQGPMFVSAARADGEEIAAEVIDLNSSGVSFRVVEPSPYRLETGEVLKNIRIGGLPATCSSATVVYVASERSDDHARRVGIQFDVLRRPYEFHRIEFTGSNRQPSARTISAEDAGPVASNINVVRYYNERDEEIVALVNSTRELAAGVAIPVVLIPPALGRRKETLGLLAFTIVENFRKHGKDVAVIRYDGIRTVGESYNDRECRSPGKEMLNFTMSQSVEDLLTTLEFVEQQTRMRCTDVVILGFSMVSIIARRAIVQDTKRRIGLCINVMGSTDVEDFLFNASGGVDYLREYQSGLQNGEFQVLGCLMKRSMFGDILDNDMAYIQSARQDMAMMDIPVVWISGTYDYWTNQKRIEDLMSAATLASRVLYEVPTGHIVKTSDEAMQVFDLIVRIIWQHLFQSTVIPVFPDPNQAKKISAAEWERVKRKDIDSKTYWKQYLLDKDEQKVGYDVLAFADDYNEFLEAEMRLLRLDSADVVADIGGGTGGFLNFCLEKHLSGRGALDGQPFKRMIIVDLVREALCRARVKQEKFLDRSNKLDTTVGFVVGDTDLVGRTLAIPVQDACFTKVLASLLVSYLKNPRGLVSECYRILQPEGVAVLSSLKPDADMSKPVTELLEKIKLSTDSVAGVSKETLLASAQSFMNLAASLFDLEEEMVFKFYTSEELRSLLEGAGFQHVAVYEAFGNPPQALIAVGRKTK